MSQGPAAVVAAAVPRLFQPMTIRGLTIRNRIWVSPMCQYSSEDGFANDWHLVHLGARASGGAGLVMMEATAVEPRGRISPDDMGLWKDEHVAKLKQITAYIKSQGAVPAIQLAHAGRKASTYAPWKGAGKVDEAKGGWQVIGPSAIPFADNYPQPVAMSAQDIEEVVAAFGQAARRALEAGFEVVEIHGAHGYLLHEFLSPVSNHRHDEYGGSLENRARLILRVAREVRKVWPQELPLFARLSCTDWLEDQQPPEGSWDLEQSVQLSKLLKAEGVDLIDASSGALAPHARIPAAPGYQVPFATRIRKEAGVLTAAVGLITEPVQAEEILVNEQADAVFLAREFLRQPYFALMAAKALKYEGPWPKQYTYARPKI